MNADVEELTDQKLVSQSLVDVASFGLLIQRYEERLKRYILRISHFSEAGAEEILQEVFLKVWKNLRSYDLNLSFSSWIYRITHHETITAYRKDHSRGYDRQVSFDTELYQMASDELDIPDKLDRKQRAEMVKTILNGLSDDFREILVLRYYEDKSYEEISDILKKPTGTIASLVNRAKKAFQLSLKRYQNHL